MNRAIKIVSIVLLALAVMLALAAWSMSKRSAKATATESAPGARPVPTHPVVVLNRALKAGQPIGAEALKVDALPLKIEGSFATPAPLIGRRTALDLPAGAPVLETQLMSGLALKVAPGERAVALRVDDVIGVGHRIRPGDLVDVFVVFKREDREINDSGARLLLPALRVLAYGANSMEAPAEAVSQPQGEAAVSSGAAQNRRDQPRSAVLAVPVDQVAALMLAEQSAHLGLALRHPEDKTVPALAPLVGARAVLPAAAASAGGSPEDRALAGLTLSSMGGASAKVGTASARPATARAPAQSSARSAPAGSTVEVLRGTKQEHIPL